MRTLCCVNAKNATCNRQQPDPSQLPPGHTSKRNLHTCLDTTKYTYVHCTSSDAILSIAMTTI